MASLDEKYGVGLQAAALDVFETMIGTVPASIEDDPGPIDPQHDEILGTLGFTGTRSGALTLHASKDLAAGLCAGMLGMSPEEIESDEEVADGFGEIANMIGGNFKNLWVEDGNSMELAIPSVQFGTSVSKQFHCTGQTVFAIRMVLDDGAMVARLWFED